MTVKIDQWGVRALRETDQGSSRRRSGFSEEHEILINVLVYFSLKQLLEGSWGSVAVFPLPTLASFSIEWGLFGKAVHLFCFVFHEAVFRVLTN